METNNILYFAYASNTNLERMEQYCAFAERVGNAALEGYRLEFRGDRYGYATIVPAPGETVEGVLWKISAWDRERLDDHEGVPWLYSKHTVTVKDSSGAEHEAMVYIMNAPAKDIPCLPTDNYLKGILYGCWSNHIPTDKVDAALRRVQNQLAQQKSQPQKSERQAR